MAENSLSQTASIDNDLINTELGGHPAILSTDVAQRFQKKHQHILREIARLCSILPKSFHQSNFGLMFHDVKIGNGATRKDKAYLLTRDAFTLLAMGFTGKEALEWKLRYIEAFNALEKAALESNTELARQAGYQQGLDEAQSLPAMEAERKKGYLSGLREAQRIWARNNSPRALTRMIELRNKGCTWKEVGRILGISASAARLRVIRALKRLGVSL